MGDLDAVTTFCELAVPLVARLTERLGLPGNTVEAVDTARNKYAARAAMSAAKLPTPKNFLIEAGEQLDEAAEHVGFPAVIKPISGAASIGVVRVDDKEQLKQKYAQCAPCAFCIHSNIRHPEQRPFCWCDGGTAMWHPAYAADVFGSHGLLPCAESSAT